MIRALPFIFFVLLGLILATVLIRGKDPARVSSVLIGRPAPVFAMDGLTQRDLQGHISVVNFFASWCMTCRVEHPSLTKLSHDKTIRVYGVAYKDSPKKTAHWLERHGNPYAKVGHDKEGRAAIEWGVYGVPETFVVDEKGIVRYRHVGAITPDDYKEIFVPLLAELRK